MLNLAFADLLKLPPIRHCRDHVGQFVLVALQHAINMFGLTGINRDSEWFGPPPISSPPSFSASLAPQFARCTDQYVGANYRTRPPPEGLKLHNWTARSVTEHGFVKEI